MKASKLNLSKIAIAAAIAFAATSAMATKPDPTPVPTTGPIAGAVAGAAAGAIGVGVGQGGAATVGNVGGGAATVGNVAGGSSTNNIGNASGLGSKSFSPEANANSTNLNTNTNANNNLNNNTQGQQQGQGQLQGQLQGQQQAIDNSGNNTGNAVVTFNEAAQPAHTTHKATIKNVGDVVLGAPASGPCNGFSGGFGVSGPGFNVGANTSTVDKGCTQREVVRVAAAVGRMDVANAVLENIDIVQEALKAKEERERAKKTADATSVTTSNVAAAPAANTWVDSEGKVAYVGTDEAIIKRLGLVKAQTVAAN